MELLAKLITAFIPIKSMRKKCRNYLSRKLNKNIKFVNTQLIDALARNEKIIFCPAGQGDTLLTLGFKKAIEDKYGKIFWIIRPNHAILAKMYKLVNFAIATEDELFATDICKKIYPTAKNIYDVAAQTLNIEKNKIFVAHPYYMNGGKHSERKYSEFKSFIADFLDIPIDSEFCYPDVNMPLNDSFKKKVEKFAKNYDNLVIICPEHGACEDIDYGIEFWEKIVASLKNKGYDVIQNSKKSSNAIKGAVILPMTTEDLIPLCLKSKMVISSRSGLCDVVSTKGSGLIVITPSQDLYDICGLNKTFERNDIKELIYSNSTLDEIISLIS